MDKKLEMACADSGIGYTCGRCGAKVIPFVPCLCESLAAPPAQPVATKVPDSIVGNILDHWEMLPNDTKQDLKDQETGFYNAMERLTDWIEENR